MKMLVSVISVQNNRLRHIDIAVPLVNELIPLLADADGGNAIFVPRMASLG